MKDRWSQLSMSEKSDLMSLYIRNGISSLEEIKKHYNSFATGGSMSPDEPPESEDNKIYQSIWNISKEENPNGQKERLEIMAANNYVKPYTAVLRTYPYFHKNYVVSHSALRAYRDGFDYQMNPVSVSKYFDNSNYNLFNNNCSDATGEALNLDTKGLTTPKYIREQVLKKHPDAKEHTREDNVIFTKFPISKAEYDRIKAEQIKQTRINNGEVSENYSIEDALHDNTFATGGQMNTDGPDDPEKDKIYIARPLNEVQIIGQRNPVQADILQQHLDSVNSFYYNDVVPRLQREHQGLKTKPDINFPYLNIEDIDFNPIRLGKDKAAAYVNPIFPSKIHSYTTPEARYFEEDMAHENSHRWQFEYPKRDKQYKDKSKEMLRQAYGNYTNKFRNVYKSLPAFILFGPNRTMINTEYESDNRAVRYNIWRDYKDLYHRTPTIEELDKYIDEIPALDLYKKYIKPSGYLDVYSKPPAKKDEQYRDFYKSKMEDFEENVQKVREALKHVAQNNTTEDTVHYAALGGHLYQVGGPVSKKTPNFVQRFNEGNKRDIPFQGGHATHLLSYAERDGKYYVYPEVQPTDYNNSNSPLQYYGRDWRVAFDRAYDNNDYLEFDTEEAARNYSENYKKIPSTGAVLNGRNRGNYNILDYMRGYATGGSIEDSHKFGDGSPLNTQNQAVDNWMRYWYNNRIPVATNNIMQYEGAEQSFENLFDNLNVTKNKLNYALDEVSKIPIAYKPLAQDYNGFYRDDIKDISLKYGAADDVLVHEKAHALHDFLGNRWEENNKVMQDSPLWEAIGDVTTGDLYEDKNGKYIYDSYLDDVNEIYSRLMQIRYNNNLNPRKKWNLQEIKKLREEGKLNLPESDGLERYTDEFILHLFNDVAQNDSSQDTSYYAALGGLLPLLQTNS